MKIKTIFSTIFKFIKYFIIIVIIFNIISFYQIVIDYQYFNILILIINYFKLFNYNLIPFLYI